MNERNLGYLQTAREKPKGRLVPDKEIANISLNPDAKIIRSQDWRLIDAQKSRILPSVQDDAQKRRELVAA